jgi:hypothetical protein
MTNVVTLKRETFRTGQSWAIGDVLHHQPVRPIRRGRRHRDLNGHAVLSVAGPEFFQGRSLGHPVVRGGERLFRAPWTPSPDAEPGGNLRLGASGSGSGTGEVLSLSRHPVMEWNEMVGGTGLEPVTLRCECSTIPLALADAARDDSYFCVVAHGLHPYS